MKTYSELSKSTNSLQSMIIMNANESMLPVAGMFVTRFMYTDRRSYKIASVEGNRITCIDGRIYKSTKRGLTSEKWNGSWTLDKDTRITNSDLYHYDFSF